MWKKLFEMVIGANLHMAFAQGAPETLSNPCSLGLSEENGRAMFVCHHETCTIPCHNGYSKDALDFRACQRPGTMRFTT